MNDDGYLFILYLVILMGCLVCLYIEIIRIKNLIDGAIFPKQKYHSIITNSFFVFFDAYFYFNLEPSQSN